MNNLVSLNENQLKNLDIIKNYIDETPIGKLIVLGCIYVGTQLIKNGFTFKTEKFTFSVGA